MKLFNQVKLSKPKSSTFDLSHEKKLTMNMGNLIPIYMDEILPGDKFRVNTEMLIRFHPMLAPLMHRIDATIHYFYVPNRLIFKNWDKFITGGEDGADVTAMPTIDPSTSSQIAAGTLADYLGVPTGTITAAPVISALPFRAYQLIWDEYYRDQNLQAKSGMTTDDIVSEGEETALLTLRKRAWTKDYFTSALPWAQKGGEVLMPMEADVNYRNVSDVVSSPLGVPSGAATLASHTDGTLIQLGAPTSTLRLENIESIENATTTINDLRTATRVQEWLEKNARAGSRLFESLLVHFGVVSDDLRLGRPQFLGGGKVPVTISEVLSTFENAEVDLGQMAGHGISAGNNASFKGYFKEHGFVMGLLSVTPKNSYQNGLPKLFTRVDKFDFAWPEFANLGEQEIKNSEIFYDFTTPANNEGTFGYTPRYAEYKFGRNTVHGDFKGSLSFWHAGRIFTNAPQLNEDFIQCDTTEIDDRIFAVADAGATHKLFVQLYNNVRAVRPLPYYGTPRL